MSDETCDVVVVGGGAAGSERGADPGPGAALGAGGRRGRPRATPRPRQCTTTWAGRAPRPASCSRSGAPRWRATAARSSAGARRWRPSAGTAGSASRWTAGARSRRAGCWWRPGWSTSCPTCPGWRERWGRDVLHCPYCHGWEVRDRRIGVLATGPMAVHQALLRRASGPTTSPLVNDAPSSTATAEAEASRPADRGRGRREGDRPSSMTGRLWPARRSPTCGTTVARSTRSPCAPVRGPGRRSSTTLGPAVGRAADGRRAGRRRSLGRQPGGPTAVDGRVGVPAMPPTCGSVVITAAAAGRRRRPRRSTPTWSPRTSAGP